MIVSEMNFTRLTKEDYVAITDYSKSTKNRMCDFSVGAVVMWDEYFNCKYCFDDTLIIQGSFPNGETYYSIVGDGEYGEMLLRLKEYAMQKDGYFCLYPVAPDNIEYYSDLLGKCTADIEGDWFDYVYNIDDLALLSGKKYHSQKNLVNRFIRDYPNVICETLTQENLPSAIEYAQKYCQAHSLEDDITTMALYECKKAIKLLQDYDSFDFLGAVFIVDKNVVGLTVGEVRGNTAFIHIEKSERSFVGLNSFVSNWFVKKIKDTFPLVAFINREEDVGDIGLRQAKERYHPVEKLYKSFLTWDK